MKLLRTFKWNVGAISLRCERHFAPVENKKKSDNEKDGN